MIAPPPPVFDDEPAQPDPEPVALRASGASGTSAAEVWAVVLGVDDYPGDRSDLRSAVADASDVDTALRRFGVPRSHTLTLYNREVSGAAIRGGVQWLVDRAGREDTVAFFFAGHVRKVGSGTEAMVGADGRMVTDDELAALLSPLRARRTWIALATCYAGGFTEVLAPGRILTGAADGDSLAYENTYYGRSYLVQFMIREGWLEERAGPSVESAFSYARRAISAYHPNRMPVQYDLADGDLRFDSVDPSDGSAPSAPSAAPSGDTSGGGDDDEGERDCFAVIAFCSSSESSRGGSRDRLLG